MKQITVLSLFPEMISNALSFGIIKRASNSIQINSLSLRDWGIGEYQRVDEPVVAPGPGMLLRPDVLSKAVNFSKNDDAYVVHLSPRGFVLNNQKAKELAQKDHLVLIASRYEGVDQRFIDHYVDEEISIGDYVLSGGELASLVLIDSVLRMTGEVLRQDAVDEESFQNGLLEYAHYTKPDVFEGEVVPSYLKSGNHQLIKEKRFIEQLYWTWKRRPDLFCDFDLCYINLKNKNPLKKIKKQNELLKKRLDAFEKLIQEKKNG